MKTALVPQGERDTRSRPKGGSTRPSAGKFWSASWMTPSSTTWGTSSAGPATKGRSIQRRKKCSTSQRRACRGSNSRS